MRELYQVYGQIGFMVFLYRYGKYPGREFGKEGLL